MDMLSCHACGMRFRSMNAEAKHRHSFPALCNKKSRQWKAFQKELEDSKKKAETKDTE